MGSRSCLILGATGLVGGHVLRFVLDDPAYAKVVVLVRRSLGIDSAKLVEVVTDFDRPETYRASVAFRAVDDVFSCLGTTIKKAGSQEAFRKVDFEYPVAVARAASAAGARQYLIVTAVGADSTSRVFYNRAKGEVEDALRAIAFPDGLKMFHPSLLLGDRDESRPAERAASVVMKATSGLFVGALKRYRAIDASHVARAMWKAARTEPAGTRVYEGASLFDLAQRD